MKPTISIGIAAYNEEKNIGSLLRELLTQKINSAELVEILVVSDASTDKTVTIVQSTNSSKIKLVELTERRGAIHAKNIMFDKISSSILVMLDADILPENEFFIEKLIEPIIKNPSVGLTSAALLPSRAHSATFTEKVLIWNHEWKQELFLSTTNGNNIYGCFGPAQALSSKLYKKITYQDNLPYDALSYMLCITNKLNFVSVKYPRAIFRCPTNLKDHIRQSSRFAAGKEAIIHIFGDVAEKAYKLPTKYFFLKVAKEVLSRPIFSLYFFVIWFYTRKYKETKFTSLWDMSESSKQLKTQ